MTDTLSTRPTSVPSSPVGGPAGKQAKVGLSDPALPVPVDRAQSLSLEELREQLAAAKIPVSKRASVAEVPASADDCQFLAGTTRCTLPLCEDACARRHSHHRTHAKPLAPDAPLVYARPSISMQQGMALLGSTSAEGSPAGSAAPSRNTSPQAAYRRASAFGFNFGGTGGSNRGSMVASQLLPSGSASGFHTPADLDAAFASGPPSPLSGSDRDSARSSAHNSPRERTAPSVSAAALAERPLGLSRPSSLQAASTAPESTLDTSSLLAALPPVQAQVQSQAHAQAQPSASSSGSQSSVSGPAPPVNRDTAYWKLRQHIVNLADYRPGVVGIGTAEARARTDLAPAPREDFEDQTDCSWDPRSPQPPSPVDISSAQVLQVNMNQQDRTKPEIEYVIRPTH